MKSRTLIEASRFCSGHQYLHHGVRIRRGGIPCRSPKYPNIRSPNVQITTAYPGASPTQSPAPSQPPLEGRAINGGA